MEEQRWGAIAGFPNYEISDLGEVQNLETGRIMAHSRTQSGHLKVNLFHGQFQSTRSVHRLVAEAFVERPGDRSGTMAPCDTVIALDGDVANVAASNLAWRSRTVAWRYAAQFRDPIPGAWHLMKVRNIDTRTRYDSIVEAGIGDGVLWDDIWASVNGIRRVAPFGHSYEIDDRL
jgi:hypothetical protein